MLFVVLAFFAGAACGFLVACPMIKYTTSTNKLYRDRKAYEQYYSIACAFFYLIIDKADISRFLSHNKINTVAIYGRGTLGAMLIKYLTSVTDCKIKYIIEKKDLSDKQFKGIPVISLGAVSDELGVDAIIVTPVYGFTSIKADLRIKTSAFIVSLEEVAVAARLSQEKDCFVQIFGE